MIKAVIGAVVYTNEPLQHDCKIQPLIYSPGNIKGNIYPYAIAGILPSLSDILTHQLVVYPLSTLVILLADHILAAYSREQQ